MQRHEEIITLEGSIDEFLVRFQLTLKTQELMIESYPAYQTELYDLVI